MSYEKRFGECCSIWPLGMGIRSPGKGPAKDWPPERMLASGKKCCSESLRKLNTLAEDPYYDPSRPT